MVDILCSVSPSLKVFASQSFAILSINIITACFYRIAPAMLRQASYGTIKIGTYQSLKRMFVEHPEGECVFFFSV